MSIRFMIKNTASKAEKEGDVIVRYSGTSEPFYRVSERSAYSIGTDKEGKPRVVFTTGLEDDQVQFYDWCTEEEKKLLLKSMKEMKKLISDYFGGSEVIDKTNQHFWYKDRRVARISLTDQDMDVMYDTKDPISALLYLSIMAGAFEDLIAPNRDYAERRQRQHFLALETDGDESDDNEEVTRMDAMAALSELKKNSDPEALFILAWCIQYDTKSYGAYLKSTPYKDLLSYHIKYIDGKLVTKKKKNTPKVFLEYAEKWKAPLTKNALYAEAYVKAGEYYNFLHNRDGKLTTPDGTILGKNVSEAVDAILKPKNSSDLEKLRDQVESKWLE